MYNSSTHVLTKDSGLSIDEVRQCLGATTRDLATLCVHASVNRWAKYKPLRHTSIGELTEAQRAAANYGLGNIPYYTYVATMLSDVRDGTMLHAANVSELDTRLDAWQYYKPAGGIVGTSASPYRLLDFDGYWHDAVAPIDKTSTPSAIRAADGMVNIGFRGASIDDPKTLKLEDITVHGVAWPNMYLTLCLYNSSIQYYVTQMSTADDVTTAIKISQLDQYGIFFRTRGIPAGTYKAFVFASDRVIPVSQSLATAGMFVPMAFSLSDISIVQATVDISFSVAAWRQSPTAAIYGSYAIVNNDNTGYTLGNITLDFLAADGTVLHSTTLATPATIAAQAEVYSGQLTLATASVVSAYRLRLASDIRGTITVGGHQFTAASSITPNPPRE